MVETSHRSLMKRVVDQLAGVIGERYGGGPGDRQSIDFLCAMFQDMGLPVERQRVSFIGWELLEPPSLTLLSPVRRDVAAAPLLYSASTPPDGVTGRLVRRGFISLIPGVYEFPLYAVVDQSGVDLAHVLVETGGPAIALLNPEPIHQFPRVVIGFDDQVRIEHLLEQGEEVNARVCIRGRLLPTASSHNVICRLGRQDSDKRVVVCAHSDSPLGSPGAYDNAAGVAALFGVADALDGVSLPFAVDLVAMACEELGFIGSRFYVNDLYQRDRLADVRACINLDMVSGGEFLWVWSSPGSFRSHVGAILDAIGISDKYDVKLDSSKPGDDAWAFHERGIPTASMIFWRQAEYHQPTDTPDLVDWAKVEDTVRTVVELLRAL